MLISLNVEGIDLTYEGIATAVSFVISVQIVLEGIDLTYEGIATLMFNKFKSKTLIREGIDLTYEGIATPFYLHLMP